MLISAAPASRAQSFASGTNAATGTLFYDGFDDNRKDQNKWTPLCGSGVWEERNQRMEFQVYETICPVPDAVGIESTPIGAYVNADVPVTVSFFLKSDIGSTSWNGHPCFELSDGVNWLKIQYEMRPPGEDPSFSSQAGFEGQPSRTYIEDSAGNVTVMHYQYPGEWWTQVDIYDDRYRVKIGFQDSGWVDYRPAGGGDYATLKFYLKTEGRQPDLYARCGFDEVRVTGIPAWEEKVYKFMFDQTEDIRTFREFRDERLLYDELGKNLTNSLYRNGDAAMAVLVNHPELMREAGRLAALHKGAVADVLAGREGVVTNSAEVILFLDAAAAESPPELKNLLMEVRTRMIRKQQAGETFLGFRLR
jgi:hypothetical protein